MLHSDTGPHVAPIPGDPKPIRDLRCAVRHLEDAPRDRVELTRYAIRRGLVEP